MFLLFVSSYSLFLTLYLHVVLPSDESVLYVTSDKLKRPYQIWSNKLGNPASNKLVFNNQCERYFTF